MIETEIRIQNIHVKTLQIAARALAVLVMVCAKAGVAADAEKMTSKGKIRCQARTDNPQIFWKVRRNMDVYEPEPPRTLFIS